MLKKIIDRTDYTYKIIGPSVNLDHPKINA